MEKIYTYLITVLSLSSCSALAKPNVVIFYADDFGWGDFRLHNSDPVYFRYTPHMDRIFTEGVELENYMTHSVCSPSRAGLLTGKHYANVGAGPQTGGTLPNDIQNFAKDFKAAGYATGTFGKWHNGHPNFPDGGNGADVDYNLAATYNDLHQEKTLNLTNNIFENHKGWLWGEGVNAYGFDRWVGYYGGGGDMFDRYGNWHHDVDWWHDRNYIGIEAGYTTDLITYYSNEFIDANQNGPFVCYVSQQAVHNPLQLKRSDLQEFCGYLDTELGITGQWDFVKNIQGLYKVNPLTGERDDVNGVYRTIENTAEIRAGEGEEFHVEVLDPAEEHFEPLMFAAFCYTLDKSIGAIMQKVTDIGQFTNTVFIFASDNGSTSKGVNLPFRGSKGSLYDGGVHVPAAIWWPGTFDKNTAPYSPGNNVYSGFIGYTDIYPTLMSMTGQPLLGTNLDGIDCWAHLQNNTECRPDLTDAVFWMETDYGAARTERWKLIYSESKNQIDLYDLYADVGEATDVQGSNPAVRDQLIALYKNWLTQNSYAVPYVTIDESDIPFPNPAPDGEALEVKATQTGTISNPDSNGMFVRFSAGTGWDEDYADYVQCGDRVEYDIYVCADSDVTQGCFYTPGSSAPLFKSNNGLNQNGQTLAKVNLPKEVWTRQVIGVGSACPTTFTINYLSLCGASAGYYHYYLDNIIIRKADGGVRAVIWQSDSDFSSLKYRYNNVEYSSVADAQTAGAPFSSASLTAIDIEQPVITSTPDLLAVESLEYTYPITATDLTGDPLTYTAPVLPSWLTFTNQVLSGIPGSNDLGVHNVTLSVSDGTFTTNQVFTITVSNPGFDIVPDVIGQDQVTAETNITAAGFAVGSVITGYARFAMSGDVVSTDPAAGQSAPLGSSVDLTVMEATNSYTTIDWAPGGGSSDWIADASWSGGAAPLRETQNVKVRFLNDSQECVLTTSAAVRQLVMGNGGATHSYLRLKPGADLYAGLKPNGEGSEWTAVGYSMSSTLTVETNAVFATHAHLLLGRDGGDSLLNIDGGTVNIATTILMGHIAHTSSGFITIDGGGVLTATDFTMKSTNSVVNIIDGTLILDGDDTTDVNAWISQGIIVGYGGGGAVTVEYGQANPGKTTVTATPPASGYDTWASANGVVQGPLGDDDDDGLNNLSEYAVSEPPVFTRAEDLFTYVYKQRNDDPNLTYELQTCIDLISGSWTNTGYTITGTNVTGGTYDEVNASISTTGSQLYIRLKITNQ